MSKKPLTVQLITQRAKSDSLFNIKSLNLWGNDLDDLSVLEQLPNLEVLSLSVNHISTLADIAKCPSLKELYLRKNNISEISELRFLQKLPKLKILWLQDNPCTDHPNYRELVIVNSNCLEKLDNLDITPQDRANAQAMLAPPPTKPERHRNEWSGGHNSRLEQPIQNQPPPVQPPSYNNHSHYQQPIEYQQSPPKAVQLLDNQAQELQVSQVYEDTYTEQQVILAQI